MTRAILFFTLAICLAITSCSTEQTANTPSAAVMLLPPVPKATAKFIVKPVQTNWPTITLQLVWRDRRDTTFQLEFGTNHNYYTFTNLIAGTNTGLVTIPNSKPYWYFRIRTIKDGEVSDWSTEARYPAWPDDSIELTWTPVTTNCTVEASNDLKNWRIVQPPGRRRYVAPFTNDFIFFRTSADVAVTNKIRALYIGNPNDILPP